MITTLDLTGIQTYVSNAEISQAIEANAAGFSALIHGESVGPQDAGWLSPSRWHNHPLMERLQMLASQIRTQAEVFVLIGVGGSNRGAQSVIESLGDRKVEILYAGDNLSSQALKTTLAHIKGRPVCLNLIAKDFNTLEPGIAFRFLRQYMESAYGPAAKERIIVTGSQGEGQLHPLSQACGYTYLPFPPDMGGRFSVISAVGLLPIAVAGVDITQIIQGASAAQAELQTQDLANNPACQYAAARNLLYEKGFVIENLVTLEPGLVHFARWWSQLFGETEGKNQRCIFPTTSLYSEDLHAVGQYIQEGKRMVMETFLDARWRNPELIIQPSQVKDGFDYLDHKPFDDLNWAAFQAAFTAHQQGGVPCIRFACGEPTPSLFGELFYLFMLSCCLSATMIGVNPFGQPGVEAYKHNMYQILGKHAMEAGF